MATTSRTIGFNATPKDPAYSGGKKYLSVFARKVITAAGAAVGDIVILSGPHSFDQRIAAVKGVTPAITSATSNDLGFYKLNADGTFSPVITSGGAELFSAVDLTSAKVYNDQLELNATLDRTKNIGQLLSLTSESEPTNGTYIGFRMNVASTATTVTLALEVVAEEANTK